MPDPDGHREGGLPPSLASNVKACEGISHAKDLRAVSSPPPWAVWSEVAGHQEGPCRTVTVWRVYRQVSGGDTG